jgi:hypothetical protein
MSCCPHCQRSLNFVDVRRKVLRAGVAWSPPVLSQPLCPFCDGAVRPRRRLLSRTILFFGTLVSLPSGALLAAALHKSVPYLLGFIVIGCPVIATLATLWCAKAIIHYEKSDS